jgi:hypothetical protein
MKLINRLTLLLMISLTLLSSIPSLAALRYVRSDANGSGNGSDWTNAYTDLPSNLNRGDTYYIADGSYRPHTFGDANSGTTLITIKKATIADHGTSVGWSDSLGDGEALFTGNDSIWIFKPGVGYYEFLGQRGSGNTHGSYGFRITSTASRNSAAALVEPDLSGVYNSTGGNTHIYFSGIEFDWNNGTAVGASGATRAVQWNTAIGNTGIHFSNCYIHHSSGFGIYAASMASDFVVENCFFERNGGATVNHHETLWVTGVNGFTFRNNTIQDTVDGALTGWLMLGTVKNVDIYNNVFACTSPSACSTGGNGIIATWDNNVYVNSNINIFNNTFANFPTSGNPSIYFYHSGGAVDTNVVVRNNLYITGSFGITGATTMSNEACGGGATCSGTNAQNGLSSAIFRNWAAQDFRLVSPTNAGYATSFTTDKLGVQRGADGVWDRGAFEFGGTVATPTPTATPVATATPTPTPVPTATPIATATPVPTATPSVTGETLLGSSSPASIDANDGVAYELGMKFSATTAGQITAIRFYKSPSESGTHTGKIYSSSGALLASVTFINESASGWQSAYLTTPLAIAANTTYTVSVNTGAGYYVSTAGDFATAKSSADLRTPVSAGVYGAAGAVPTQSFQSSNYFRDVVFVVGSTATPSPTPVPTATPPQTDTVKPTVAVTSPTDGSRVARSNTATITADASDNVAVTKVEFYVNGTLKCTDTSAPYSCAWAVPRGRNVPYAIQAKAYDAAGNSGTSATINVTSR